MRLLSAVIAAAAVALALAPPTMAAKPTCAQRGSETVLRKDGVRVFTAPGRYSDEVVLYGCLTADGRKRELAAIDPEDGVDTFFTGFSSVRVAGTYVAWHFFEFSAGCKADCSPGYDPTTDSLHVYDLRRRRKTSKVDVPDLTGGSLALTQQGGLAWLAPTLAPGVLQLSVADRGGTRVLDSGAIAPASVRAEISIVSWVRDGVEHFARLR